MTREEAFVRLLNLGIPVAEVEAALTDPRAAIDRYEAAVLFLPCAVAVRYFWHPRAKAW